VTVKAVESLFGRLSAAVPSSDLVSIGLLGELDPSQLFPGLVLSDPEHPVSCTDTFTAQVITMPSLSRPIIQGTPVICHTGGWAEAGVVTKLVRAIQRGRRSDGDHSGSAPRRLRLLAKNQSAEIQVTLRRGAIPLTVFAECKPLGRVVLRAKGKTLAAGVVTQTKPDDAP